MQTRLTLVRHGQTEWNATGKWQGHAAVPLDDVGHMQAQALAQYLTTWNIHRMYCSDLSRCIQTARYIKEALELDFMIDNRLREIDVGEWQGLTEQEVRAWDAERFAQVMANPFNVRRPGGESFNDHSARVSPAIIEYVKNHQGEHLLVVTHGGTIHAVVRGVLRMEVPADKRQIPNTSLTDIIFDADKNEWRLVSAGLIPHLELTEMILPTRVANPELK